LCLCAVADGGFLAGVDRPIAALVLARSAAARPGRKRQNRSRRSRHRFSGAPRFALRHWHAIGVGIGGPLLAGPHRPRLRTYPDAVARRHGPTGRGARLASASFVLGGARGGGANATTRQWLAAYFTQRVEGPGQPHLWDGVARSWLVSHGRLIP